MTILTSAADIAVALATRLATISIASGSHTDIGTRVLRGRRRIDDNMVPCAVLIEGTDEVTPPPGRLTVCEVKQRYIVAAYAECHPDHPNDRAHEIIKDIKRAIFKGGVTLDGQVRKIEYKGRDIGPRSDGVSIVCASVEFEVTYAEDLTNP